MAAMRAGNAIELTSQQRHVLRLVAVGCSTQEIAARLRISARTAQWHISRLMTMFDVPNRAALVYAALSAHLLPRFDHGRVVDLLRKTDREP
jgi:DNA-binding CsgD family transcriptional regulator